MIDMKNYGWQPSMLQEDVDGIPARITAVHRERYELVCSHGTIFGKLKTAVYYGQGEDFPTVGDFVFVRYGASGDSLIIKTFPRKSFFSRREPGPIPRDQAVAANFDTVFLMTSLNRDFNVGRLERYLTLAWQSNATPVVILTKADLADEYEAQIQAVQEIAVGIDVIAVSAVTGQGLGIISNYLQPQKTVVFLGSSGVGKSSLLNALAGEKLMDIKAIRENDSRGRHTTTHRQLFMLPYGAMVIDTPGMRELGMWDVSSGLGEAFSDVKEVLSRGCKFTDCHHQTEPGCAVKSAIENGELSADRWQSYLKLKHEAKYTDDKIGFMRERQQWHKSLAKWSKQQKKNGGIKK
ncbi:MAG: ribosome small subunit-dependent GTPase A [Oscillospiraceae bacterium]|nr:ribosome small subunit-dependent GTPase A [Oscillospiraceae bacterium]